MATKSTYRFIGVISNSEKFELELEESARSGWVVSHYSHTKTQSGGSTYGAIMVRADAEHV